jgi:hypothetical protein
MMMIEEEGVLVIFMMHLFWRVDFVVIVPSTSNQSIACHHYIRHNKASPHSLTPSLTLCYSSLACLPDDPTATATAALTGWLTGCILLQS